MSLERMEVVKVTLCGRLYDVLTLLLSASREIVLRSILAAAFGQGGGSGC
jgi:hypothetical protein